MLSELPEPLKIRILLTHGGNGTPGSARKELRFQKGTTEMPNDGQSLFLLPPVSAPPAPPQSQSPALTRKQHIVRTEPVEVQDLGREEALREYDYTETGAMLRKRKENPTGADLNQLVF